MVVLTEQQAFYAGLYGPLPFVMTKVRTIPSRGELVGVLNRQAGAVAMLIHLVKIEVLGAGVIVSLGVTT